MLINFKIIDSCHLSSSSFILEMLHDLLFHFLADKLIVLIKDHLYHVDLTRLLDVVDIDIGVLNKVKVISQLVKDFIALY